MGYYDDVGHHSIIDFWPDGEVLTEFYESEATFSLIRGPYGSAKTKTAAAKLVDFIFDMPADRNGVRRSKWLVFRNYEGDLKETTIPDFLSVLPGEGLGMVEMRWTSPIVAVIDCDGDDGLPVYAEIEFMPLNNPDEAKKKLKGREYTGGWGNEISENVVETFITAIGRGNRYPPHGEMPDIPINDDGDRYQMRWIFDTNSFDDEHWLYQLMEMPTPEQQEIWETFSQPGGVVRDIDTGGWLPNPLAENMNNLPPSYYKNQLANNAGNDDWIKINLANEYGSIMTGRRVWLKYSQELHETEAFDYVPGLPVEFGLDNGRTPAASLGQRQNGGIVIFDEYTSDDMSAEIFAPNFARYVASRWGIKPADMIGHCDPACKQKGQNFEASARDVMISNGFVNLTAAPCENNDLMIRRRSVANPMQRMLMNGKPAFMVHKRCKTLRKGAASKFYYKRISSADDELYTTRPVKNFYSHVCFAPGTSVETPSGEVDIESLKKGDYVSTPLGPRKVNATWSRDSERVKVETNNGATVCTYDHPFWTKSGYVQAAALGAGENIGWNNKSWNNHWKLRQYDQQEVGILSSILMALPITMRNATIEIARQGKGFTGTFGRFIKGPYRKGIIYITRMKTLLTIGLKTSSACHPASTNGIITAAKSMSIAQDRLSRRRKKGIEDGPRRTLKDSGKLAKTQESNFQKLSRMQHSLMLSVRNVGQRLSVIRSMKKGQLRTCALSHAGISTVDKTPITKKRACAHGANQHSTATSTIKAHTVRTVAPHKRGLVIGIEVDDAHAYYANGMLVSNCEATEYLCVGMGEGQAFETPTKSQDRKTTRPNTRH